MVVATRVGTLTLDYFPATILPNPLVQEIQHLLSSAGEEVLLVEEVAAGILTGRFCEKFRKAARIAIQVVGGTLYARYYGIDPEQVLSLAAPDKRSTSFVSRTRWGRVGASEPSFADLCWDRAERVPDSAWSVAANGTVLEQA